MTTARTPNSTLRAWGRLLRLPNLLTVPGDPLAGFLLVTQGHGNFLPGLWAAAASLCFYAAGLIINDLSDIATDRKERPDRPLPSGQIRPLAAAAVALALLAAGQGFSCMLDPQAWWIGFMLVLTIFLYSLGFKNIPVIGPLTMGSCRGLSVLLGASAIPATEPLSAALMLAVATIAGYVAAVSHIARREMASTPIGDERWIPAVVLVFGFALIARIQAFGSIPAWLGFSGAFLLAGIVTLEVASMLEAASHPQQREFTPWMVPYMVGLLISGLLLIQAGFIMVAGAGETGILVGLILVGVWPLHRILDKRFHAS
jgi:4-hydroxybenzoate polyprenyltransferase